MILKCFDGPMDGAVYALSRETSDPMNRSTNRKPDGLWFDGQDEHGRNVQHQYAGGNAMPLVECKEPLVFEYRYTGPVVDTGIDFETNPRGDVTSGNRPTLPDEIPDWFHAAQSLECANCAEVSTNPGRFLPDGRWVCTEVCRKELCQKQSYDDLAASGGIVDAP